MKHIKTFEFINEQFGVNEGDDTIGGLNKMANTDLERIADYADMIKDRMSQGQTLDAWMYSKISDSVKNLNSVHDTMDGNDGVVESTINEGKLQDAEKLLKDAPIGSVVKGGGYTWTKNGKNSFKSPNSDLGHAGKVASQVGGFKDFVISEPVNEAKMPDKHIGNDEIVFIKTKENSTGAQYNLYYKGYDIDAGGQSFGSEKELKAFADNYILSNQWYNKLKGKTAKPLPESVNEAEKAEGDRSKLSADIEKALKDKATESGVPIGLLRLVMRRGLDAWNSSHREGVPQVAWGYARVNAFLEKGKGTWGKADADIAKEVRDGGNASKLPIKNPSEFTKKEREA